MKTKSVIGEPRQLDMKQWRSCAIDPRAFGAWYSGGYAPTEISLGIAFVSVCGPLDHHQGWWLDSYDSIVCRVDDALADPDVRAVVMVFDTPGGDASGVEEAARKIKAMRLAADKPIYGYSNEACYSAGYWLASACDEIWLPPTGGVGSVGVIAEAYDFTAHNAEHGIRVELITTGKQKADGHPDRPLTDEIVARIQDRVNKIGAIFFASVAEGRGMKPEAVEALQAGTFLGVDAVSAGLADGVQGFDQFLENVRSEVGIDTGKNRATTKDSTMALKDIAKINAAVTAAKTALDAAKTDDEIATAAAAYASAVDAKVKYSKRTRTDELTEDDGKDDGDDGDDDAPPSSKPGKKDDEEKSESDDEGEDAKAAARAAALKALGAADGSQAANLYDRVVALTGKSDLGEALGAIDGISVRLGAVSALESRVAKIESTSRETSVGAMLKAAAKDGRIEPGQVEHLRAQGMKDPKWLKGYLASITGRVVRTIDEEAAKPKAVQGDLSIETMSVEERKMYEASAASVGLTLDQFLTHAKDFAAKNLGAARPTH
jgi:ClpP class serine protease